jgi:hypothetical protein
LGSLLFSPMLPNLSRASSNSSQPLRRDCGSSDGDDGAALALVTVKTELHESEEERDERDDGPLNLAASTTSL